MKTDFAGKRKGVVSLGEVFFLFSALLRCLIYAMSYNCSFDKVLSQLHYLPSLFVFFINADHFVIIEKVFFFFFLMPVSLSQYRGIVRIFNNIFANKRCIRSSVCYHSKTQSCEIGLTLILFILLHAFPILIGFLKKIARQNILMVYINKKFRIS